jgi:N-acetylneuraminic acid mutarotase
MYDPDSDSWMALPPMSTKRDYLAASVANGKLYIVGGFNGSERLDTAEQFDPKTKKWTEVVSMTVHRDGLAAISLAVDLPG